MLVHAHIPLLLGDGRCHVHLLFANFVGVLLLPALGLRGLELRGGEAAFLAVLDTEIFFFSLVLPCACFGQRTHRQQDVGVGIVAVGVVDRNVGAHSFIHELLPDKILQKLNLLLS